MCRLPALTLACSLVLVFSSSNAAAAGLYFTDRGVRPLARGGAFVAGADDLGAVWYNPAGVADAPKELLVDASWLAYSTTFSRETLARQSDGTETIYKHGTVEGTTPFLPIPTLAASFPLDAKGQWIAAFSVVAPYTAISSYPLTDSLGRPSGSRFLLVSLDGSALAAPAFTVAWKNDRVRVGLQANVLTGTFASKVVFSGNPEQNVLGAAEAPQYDALSTMKVGPVFAPGVQLGFQAILNAQWRIGASAAVQAPLDSDATIDVQLPSAPFFDKAKQTGNEAHVKFALPPIVRFGVEYRPNAQARVELAYVREFWSVHDRIDISPRNLSLDGITGLVGINGPFKVQPISLPRGFKDSNSLRLGGEFTLPAAIAPHTTTLRAGVAWEQSAVPTNYLSPLTVDLDKVVVSLGAGYDATPKLRLDVNTSYVITSDTYVDPHDAKVPRVAPVTGNPTDTQAVNGGHYAVNAWVLGLGGRYRWD
jgi:long-chain fatty acid transport protein